MVYTTKCTQNNNLSKWKHVFILKQSDGTRFAEKDLTSAQYYALKAKFVRVYLDDKNSAKSCFHSIYISYDQRVLGTHD